MLFYLFYFYPSVFVEVKENVNKTFTSLIQNIVSFFTQIIRIITIL
jgi:hypothetical protein